MVSPSRPAACSDAAGALPRAHRALRSDGQRYRRDHRADDGARRAHGRRSRLRLRDPARRAHASAGRRPVRALPATPHRDDARRSRSPIGGVDCDGAFRVRAPVRRQRLLRYRCGRDRGLCVRRCACGLADLSRYRINCLVGLPIRMGTARRTRHADEPRPTPADDHRGGVLHRRTVAVGGPHAPPKTLADHRIPRRCGDRLRGHHHP